MRGIEILEVFALELYVFQRDEGGESGETEKGDDGVDEGVRGGRGMRITVDVDWEPVG